MIKVLKMLNGAKNHNSIYSPSIMSSNSKRYAIKVLYKDSFIGFLNGVQNMDDGTTCLKLVSLIEDKKLVKWFLDTRSANCSIAGTKRMLKNCNYIYFYDDSMYTLKELDYDLADITMDIHEAVG